MKAKELAEQLLENPDLDVECDICVEHSTYDNPWPKYRSFRVCGIEGARIDDSAVVAVILDVEEV